MPEITIKYKNPETLNALMDFAKYFDFVIKKPKSKKAVQTVNQDLPIDFSKHPDVTALAGIWKEKNITLEDLRKNAWGDRL